MVAQMVVTVAGKHVEDAAAKQLLKILINSAGLAVKRYRLGDVQIARAVIMIRPTGEGHRRGVEPAPRRGSVESRGDKGSPSAGEREQLCSRNSDPRLASKLVAHELPGGNVPLVIG